MKYRLIKLLKVGVAIVFLSLISACVNNALTSLDKPINDTAEPTTSTKSDYLAPAIDSGAPDIGNWQTRYVLPKISGWDYLLIEDQLWYINDTGIYYYDVETERKITVNASNVDYSTALYDDYNMYFVDGSIWFTFRYIWTYYSELQAKQMHLARFDLASGQYYEYPTDIFTGVNTTIIEALGKVIVCADSSIFQYDKANDQFNKMPKYGEDIWHIAGGENLFVTYTGIYKGDSLTLYKANGEFVEYNPVDCLPDVYVTEMILLGDELFICWGGEGEPAGVACLNTQTGAWTHYIDPMSDNDFSTPHDYTPISGYGGEIWPREEDALYLRLPNSTPRSLMKYSFSQKKFECIYTTEDIIRDAISFQNGDIIAHNNGLVFLDLANNEEKILENMSVSKILKNSKDNVLAITENGVFECKLI